MAEKTGADDKSATPTTMYSWRVEALDAWIKEHETRGQPVTMEALCKAGHLDQYHYLGLYANDEIIKLLQVQGSADRLLEIGAGIGGPSRYIAWKTGCRIYAIDIQPELVEMGNKVNKVVGLSEHVVLDCVDATSDLFNMKDEFVGMYSNLVILHIPKGPRLRMFRKIYDALKPGAPFTIEDFVADEPLTHEEEQTLRDVIGCAYIPTVQEYQEQLQSAGFTDLECVSLTDIWTVWTDGRRKQFLEKKEKHVKVHGAELYAMREALYNAAADAFLGGRLGGVRITGRKQIPEGLPEGANLAAESLSARLQKGRQELGEKPTVELVQQMVDGHV